jgi:hypothetical protein
VRYVPTNSGKHLPEQSNTIKEKVMKTTALAVLSALLMSAAGPVFAMSHQERLACAWTAGNCLDRGKLLEQRVMEIKNEIAKNTNGSPDEVKKLEKKLHEAMDELKRVENES